MNLSQEQKSKLKKLGYTVKGNSVLNKDGGTVAGYNKNGNLFSGSKKVSEILKSEPKAEKPTSKPKARPATKAKPKTSSAPSKSARPMARGANSSQSMLDSVNSGLKTSVASGRKPILSAPPKVTSSKLPSGNDPVVSAARRVINKTSSDKKPASTNQKPTTAKPGRPIGELIGLLGEFTGVSAKRAAGQAYTKKKKEQEETNKNKPSFAQFNIDRQKKYREEFKKDPNKFTKDSKALYEKTYGSIGYAKGGLVKANCGASMKPTQRKR